MTDRPRYGRRCIDRMLREWNAHREAVNSGDLVAAQETLRQCEEWIDWAFGKSSEHGKP